MYCLNKIVGLLISPVFIGACLFVAGFVVALVGRRRTACWLAGASVVWFLFWTSPATYRWLASGLERMYPVMTVEETPQADAIRVLGGSVGANTNAYPYSEMWTSADRVWHAARLWKAGKAPVVFVTGEYEIPLLVDFGVPRQAIVVCEGRNTEEEARFIACAMKVRSDKCLVNSEDSPSATSRSSLLAYHSKPKVLLVTSAWHMRRAMLMFARYAPDVEVIPAATDYEALVRCGWKGGFRLKDLLPDAEMMFQNSYMLKEIVGYWGYRVVRSEK